MGYLKMPFAKFSSLFHVYVHCMIILCCMLLYSMELGGILSGSCQDRQRTP